jgi:hypothetical protein
VSQGAVDWPNPPTLHLGCTITQRNDATAESSTRHAHTKHARLASERINGCIDDRERTLVIVSKTSMALIHEFPESDAVTR